LAHAEAETQLFRSTGLRFRKGCGSNRAKISAFPVCNCETADPDPSKTPWSKARPNVAKEKRSGLQERLEVGGLDENLGQCSRTASITELRGRDEPQYCGKTVKQPLLKRSQIHARP
jgi:hypothetical protein